MGLLSFKCSPVQKLKEKNGHLAEETCQDESENPVDIKEGNDEENKNEEVNVHCYGTAKIFGGVSV